MIQKNAIVTAALGGNYDRIAAVTLPTIQAYATRIGAELLVIRSRMYPHLHVHWEKFQLGSLFKLFDRICWMDADIIVNPKAPSIFEAADPQKFAAFDEGHVFVDRVDPLAVDARYYGISIRPDRSFNYFNAGVMVASRDHAGAFMFPVKPPRGEPMSEQTYLNLQVAKLGHQFQDLTSKWNGLHSIHKRGDRADLWTVHYAGYPKTEDWVDRVLQEMKVDLAAFK